MAFMNALKGHGAQSHFQAHIQSHIGHLCRHHGADLFNRERLDDIADAMEQRPDPREDEQRVGLRGEELSTSPEALSKTMMIPEIKPSHQSGLVAIVANASIIQKMPTNANRKPRRFATVRKVCTGFTRA